MAVAIFGGLTACVYPAARLQLSAEWSHGRLSGGDRSRVINIFVGSLGLGFALSAAALYCLPALSQRHIEHHSPIPYKRIRAGRCRLYLDAFNIFWPCCEY
jgi:hypothetical protein